MSGLLKISRNTLLTILVVVIAIAVTTDYSPKEKHKPTNICVKPESIPDTLYTGDKVHWDCLWQSSYVEGNVDVVWKDVNDHAKGAAFVLRKNID